ncbi:MAG: hypothetical protein IK140_05500 [Clostridia bacterium]|nr:hypothetical protein [Clostridia bacterium]
MSYIDPNQYAHMGDDAQMIQSAVDAAQLSGQCVCIPRLNARTGRDVWVLPSAVKLHTGSTVILDSCRLRLADGAFDSIFKNDLAGTTEAELLRRRQYDIRIIGRGCALLDGGRHNGLTERNGKSSSAPRYEFDALVNTLIHLHNAERIVIENLRVENPRYWGMTFHYCSYGRISNIQFMSSGACPNADGIDLRLGCCDFIIENITGYTQDDSVALTCLNDSVARVQGLDSDIHGVVIRNVATCTRCANVRLLNHYGHKLYNVVVQNVQSSVETDPASPDADAFPLRLPDSEPLPPAVEPVYWTDFSNGARRAHVAVKIGENAYFASDRDGAGARLGDTFNIRVQNVQACSQVGVNIARTLCDSSFEGIQMFGKSAIGVYFGEGEFDTLRFSDVGFAHNALYSASDRKPREGAYGYQEPAAVVFNGSRARGLSFRGISSHPSGGHVFAGHGDVRMRAADTVLRDERFRLISGDGIILET